MSEQEEKTYVSLYLPVSLAKTLESLKEGNEGYDTIIEQYIQKTKDTIECDLEGLDESLLNYRGMMARIKNEFRKTREGYIDATDEIWEETEKSLPSLRKKLEKITQQLEPLRFTLESICSMMKQLREYDVERLLRLLEAINSCSTGESANILKFIMEKYKMDGGK